MKRRGFLSAGVAAAGAGLSLTGLAGCTAPARVSTAPLPGVTGSAQVQPLGAPFRPINASMDRVTRTLVGLRPFRKPGPRLEAVKLGSKNVVHNYGHGGGGVSLSWGVAELAADLAQDFGQPRVAVLGSGAIGLATALELQRAGGDVTIYARDFPPYTTSNVAGAMWHPVSLFEDDQVTPATIAMLNLASRIAFNRFIRYANDPRYGVYWIRQFSISENRMESDTAYMGGESLYPGLVRNQPGAPFGFRYHDAYYTLMIDPDIYLRALVSDFRSAGGRLQEATFDSAADLEGLAESTVVNCLGLGAGAVFGDESVIPARGQLSYLLPQNDIDYGYALATPELGLLYSFPRKTGIVLGGSFDKGDSDLNPREDEIVRMLAGHALLASKLR